MLSLTLQTASLPMLMTALLIWGFAPGAVLRLIVLLFPKDDPRRQELLGELYAVPRVERPFWVIEQLEVGLFEGLRHRSARRKAGGPMAVPAAGGERMPLEDEVIQRAAIGYRGPTACAAAGITYRQLDYWARTGLVEPSVRAAGGSGAQRLYSFRDILVLKMIKRLLDTGISLQQIRAAVGHLLSHGPDHLAGVTLMSDGYGIYECTSPDEVVDLLQGGQGVFGVALDRIWYEVEGTLAELPCESADGRSDELPPGHGDVDIGSVVRRRRRSQ
jgi:DNA-binding transcriptional MerR regulator